MLWYIHAQETTLEVMQERQCFGTKMANAIAPSSTVTRITRISGDDMREPKRNYLGGKVVVLRQFIKRTRDTTPGSDRTGLGLLGKGKRAEVTYQNWGKLSRSSSNQRSSSSSRSRSLMFLPSFWEVWGVVFLVMAGRVEEAAFRTSVIEVLPEACPDLRR